MNLGSITKYNKKICGTGDFKRYIQHKLYCETAKDSQKTPLYPHYITENAM